MSVDLSQHRQAYAYCAYCPKVCRFSCPVSDATQKESVSTWGKMNDAYLATEHKLPVTESNAASLYACTGCMRCRSVCKHQNEVGYALFSARALAVENKSEPKEARSTVETFRQHQNPFGRDLAALVAKFRAEAPVRFSLFPGCSTLVKRPEAIDDLRVVGEAASANFGVCRASANCCGYPLYAAGDTDAFVEHARQFARTLEPYPELAVLDPGCAYTLRVVYPRFGVSLPHPVRTVYEVLAERVASLPNKAKLALRAAFHDPCHLGRGLGQYEEPRVLLRAAVKEVVEPQETREQAHCSGGGGLVPRTMSEAATEIARRSAEKIAHEGETLVTACTTSQRMFERAGRPAEDLISLLRRWLES